MIIAIASQKGGVGKTSSSISLAAGLAKKNKRVLLIDIDSQANSKELDKIKHEYDYIFIDCPPSLSWLTINALTASDKVLVVVAPGYFELDSIVQISKTIQEVRAFFNSGLDLLGFLFTMSDPTINSETSLRLLRQTYTRQVL